MSKRAFLIVLDSFGVGYEPDADKFGDVGADTLASIRKHSAFNCPNLTKMGLFRIDGVDADEHDDLSQPAIGAYGRLQERSMGKDTTIGHWEIAGIVSDRPLPTYPNGFPDEVIEEFERRTGKKTLCNLPYSGTDVIRDYGQQAIAEDKLIVYTSADSVFQIAAHEDHVSVPELYEYCEIARELLRGEHGVGRIIARPFIGEHPYERTANRHDYSLEPPADTMLDLLKAAGYETLSVGKIFDIFVGQGVSEMNRTKSNDHGMQVTSDIQNRDFEGLCFVNLVDFDMKYGHRRDIEGYAKAMTEFDKWFGESFLPNMKDDDICILTGDHGCDPGYTKTTDHTREYVPMLMCGNKVKQDVNLSTRSSFADISATLLDYFGINKQNTAGESFLSQVTK